MRECVHMLQCALCAPRCGRTHARMCVCTHTLDAPWTHILQKAKNQMFEFTSEGGNDKWFEKKCQPCIDDDNAGEGSDDDQLNEFRDVSSKHFHFTWTWQHSSMWTKNCALISKCDSLCNKLQRADIGNDNDNDRIDASAPSLGDEKGDVANVARRSARNIGHIECGVRMVMRTLTTTHGNYDEDDPDPLVSAYDSCKLISTN